MKKEIEMLKKLTATQCTDGTWEYDSYQLGIADGLILALSVFTNETPKFLEPPEMWLIDKQEN